MIRRESLSQWNREPWLAVLLICALLSGLYFILRYGGWFTEVDAVRQAISADGILETGRLVHPRSYNNGYGYSAQLAFLAQITGINVQVAQLGASAWVFIIALAAFIAYREFLGRSSLAALATVLLFIQPDFLFYVLRGSHEKTTWAFALLMLFLLLRSNRYVRKPAHLAIYILLFYLVFYAMAAGNAYFASSFMNAIVISLAVGWFLLRLLKAGDPERANRSALLRRMFSISLLCLAIIYLFTNYVYPPAQLYYGIFSTLVDRVSLVVLGAQPAETPVSYGYFEYAWRSPAAYLSLTGLQWLISAGSLIGWAFMFRWISKMDQGTWLMWLMYTGFGGLLALSVLVDFAGFLNANLQLRLFTPFTIFSSPVVAYQLNRGFRRITGNRYQLVLPLACVVLVYAFIAVNLKVTNDPYFGNQWFFYTPAELSAGRWVEEKIENQRVWIDSSDHMAQVMDFWGGFAPEKTNTLEYGWYVSPRSYIYISRIKILRANRFGISLPSTADYDQVYDNGDVQIYHPHARTPHQR